MDVVDAKTRSRMMAGIRGRNTSPERKVRRYLHARGFRFRLNVKGLPGKPDIVLPKYGLVIFVHGCFWHRHPGCRLTSTPSTNPQRWQEKFQANVTRDKRNREHLLNQGWRVLTLWECGLRRKPEELEWLPDWIKSAEALAEWPVPPDNSKA